MVEKWHGLTGIQQKTWKENMAPFKLILRTDILRSSCQTGLM